MRDLVYELRTTVVESVAFLSVKTQGAGPHWLPGCGASEC